jgi:peptidoglycan DL-endopeptidase CwlO
VLAAAASRLGDPYQWGATGPHAFDCSGLVGWAYRQAGILLPRTAAEQWYAGPHVSYADARPGDLLFWTYDPTAPGFIDHVALYVGHGMMISAPHTGEVVRLRPVPLAHFAGVVRVSAHG